MAYTKNYDPWVNGNTNAIDATVLNTIETGIDDAHADIATLQAQPSGLTWSNKAVGDTGTSVVANDGLFVDTTGGAFNLVLPSGVAGDTVKFVDVAGNFATANFTITVFSTEKIMGVVDDTFVLSVDNDFIELVYSGVTFGWVIAGKP